ncbi:MAG TPA: phosphate ABC transporter substrate-binding protein PstS [Candidatus Nitrosotenuis sp.]|nr:phosphate ABC transporter substrate-binding protein PstS [Candidatus Nitrosotenuis sp.]
MTKTLSVVLGIILMAGVFAPLASAATPESPKSDKQFQINGAGATFPYPLIDKWRVEYNKIHPNVNLNYQSIGSGGGIQAHTAKTVNFGASDAPLQPGERDLAPGTLHIPEAIGSVVLAYNLPEVTQSGLKLTGENVADIYLGKIKRWNDPKLQDNNPDVKLPDKPILVTRRSDGSGTTYVFTDYLSKVSAEWNQKVGKGKSVPWVTGLGAAGNEGVAWATRNTKYAIGYVELAYAKSNGMTIAYLQNGDKTAFVEPTFDHVFQAADAYPIANIPKPQDDWSQVSMVLAPGANAYPIVSLTYLLLYEDLDQAVSDKDTAKTLVQMVSWMVTDGQKFSQPLGYVPLPKTIQELDKQGLARIKFYGEQILGTGDNSVMSESEKTQNKADTKSDTKKEIKVEKKSDVKKNTKVTEKKTVKKDNKTTKTITKN